VDPSDCSIGLWGTCGFCIKQSGRYNGVKSATSGLYHPRRRGSRDKREGISYRAVPAARASSASRTAPRGIIQSSRIGTIESFGKRVLRDFQGRLLAGHDLRLGRRIVGGTVADPSRPYIIAILRPDERTVSKLAELADSGTWNFRDDLPGPLVLSVSRRWKRAWPFIQISRRTVR